MVNLSRVFFGSVLVVASVLALPYYSDCLMSVGLGIVVLGATEK